jgi:hypothetical protein
MHLLRWYLWIAPNTVIGVLLVGLFRRGIWKQHRLFFSYIVIQLLSFLAYLTIALLVMHGRLSFATYRWILVGDTGVGTALELAVLYEIANQLIVSRSSLADSMRALLRWTAVALIFVAAVVAALFPQPNIERAMQAFQALSFASSLLSIGLLLALLLFTRVLRLSWRSLPAGIALGFAVMACTEMAESPLLSLGTRAYGGIDIVRMVAFHICVVIWAVYVFLPERRPSFTGIGLQKSELEFWDGEMQRMVHR